MSQDRKFLDNTGLTYYNTKIHEFIETRPIDIDQVQVNTGLTLYFAEDFESVAKPEILGVQSWHQNDLRREIRTGSGKFLKDGTFINIYSTSGTTLAALNNIKNEDSFTLRVGEHTYTGTVTEFPLGQSVDYKVDFGGFIVEWPSSFEGKDYEYLSFWPYNDGTYDGCTILNTATVLEFVSIPAVTHLSDHITAEDTQIRIAIQQAETTAVNTAVKQVKDQWFKSRQVIKGLPVLDWCLFEPRNYSDKLVLSYKNGNISDSDINLDN